MNEYLDHYCERIGPALWGEPFNIISNLGFLVVAYFLWRDYQKIDRSNVSLPSIWQKDIELLLILILTIGLGSSLWHLTAMKLALWADRIPILLFINVYLLSCVFRELRFSIANGVGLFIVYHILNAAVLLSLPIESFNRSLFYLPTWLFLGVICVVVWRQGAKTKYYYLRAFMIFTIAIAFRSVDIVACTAMPIGTHYIWHLLVSLTLYYLMMALMSTLVHTDNHIRRAQ